MITRNFSSNHNGKLLNKCFSTLRVHDPHVNTKGATHLITIGSSKRMDIGEALIRSVRTISWEQLTETMAYIDFGTSLGKLYGFLINCYKEKARSQKYDLIIYEWQSVDIEVYQGLMQKHYNHHIEPTGIMPKLFKDKAA